MKVIRELICGSVVVDYYTPMDAECVTFYSNRLLFRDHNQASLYDEQMHLVINAGFAAHNDSSPEELREVLRGMDMVRNKWGDANMQPKFREYYWNILDYLNEPRITFDPLNGQLGPIHALIGRSEIHCSDVTHIA